MDKIFLIGHRGVGKTSVLKDFSLKSKDHVCLDLDYEIETQENVNIHDLFNSGQQNKFRKLELKVLEEIIYKNKNKSLVVALGAGFELEKFVFPKNSIVLWLRRSTDSLGRIFFNRPSLFVGDPSGPVLDPLIEWQKVFKTREEKYFKYSNAKLLMPEYFDKDFNPLLEYLNFKAPEHGFVTYIPKENDIISDQNKLNLELRTDLIPEELLFKIINNKSNNKLLISIRNLNKSFLKKLFSFKKSLNQHIAKNQSQDFLIDWEIELGFPDKDHLSYIDVFSSHNDQALQNALIFNLNLIEKYGSFLKNIQFDPHYKLCPKVESHEEAIREDLLLQKYFRKDSYSYLPRSNSNLDLTYFRQLKSYQQKIGFYRFSDGSSLDQPLWWQWPQKKPKGFYGIYGQNIKHSYTPSFHKNFFDSKDLHSLSIDGLDHLKDYKDYFIQEGLKTLAVTSPYKSDVYKNSLFKGTLDIAETEVLKKNEILNFNSANTLLFFKEDQKIQSYNTDYVGLKLYFQKHIDPSLQTIVWGGGALLDQLKKILPKALFYSARSGNIRELINSKDLDKSKIKTTSAQSGLINVQIIWASGEKGLDPKFNKKINITKVIDLDYRENSKARLYSYKNKIDYVSGLDFFIEQAKAQQSIWEHYEF